MTTAPYGVERPSLVPVAERDAGDWAVLTAQQVMNNWGDDQWRNALVLAMGYVLEDMIENHQAELQAIVNEVAEKHVEKARRAVMKAYLKTNVLEIAKAYEWDERDHPRDNSGKFSRKGRLVVGRPNVPIHSASGYGPSYDDQAKNQAEAARLATEMINAYAERVKGGQKQSGAVYRIKSTSDRPPREVFTTGHPPNLGRGEYVESVRPAGIERPITLGESAFDISQALGMRPEEAAQVGGITHDFQRAVVQRDWGAKLKSLAESVSFATGRSKGPAQVQTAVALAKAVGQHGPEASKVLSPHMRRFSYKYQGTIATPAQARKVMTETAPDGTKTTVPLEPTSRTRPDGTVEVEPIHGYETKLARVLAKRIPTDNQINLLLDTGSTPPSTGFLLTPKGKVAQLAVGNSDDHYVPFNLRQLHALNGGSYIRNRAYGGPTTEDFATALAGGAKRFNVISKHGMYTVTLADSAPRFGHANRLMVNRYGRLLDAVESGKIPDPDGGVTTDGERGRLTLNGKGYEVALNALKTQFPFMIDSVQYTPASQLVDFAWRGNVAGEGVRDRGYVRPKFLKPTEAYAGYHDSSIGVPRRSYDDVEGYKWGTARLKAHNDYLRTYGTPAVAGSWRGESTATAGREGDVTLTGVSREVARNVEAGGGQGQAPKKGQPLSPEHVEHFIDGYVMPVVEHAGQNAPDILMEEYPELAMVEESFVNPETATQENQQDFNYAIAHNTPLDGITPQGRGLRDFLEELVENLKAHLANEGLAEVRINTKTGEVTEKVGPLPDAPIFQEDQGRDFEVESNSAFGAIATTRSMEQLKQDPFYDKYQKYMQQYGGPQRAGNMGLGAEKVKRFAQFHNEMLRAEGADTAGRTGDAHDAAEPQSRLTSESTRRDAEFRQPTRSEISDAALDRRAREIAGPVVGERFHPPAARSLYNDPDFSQAVERMSSSGTKHIPQDEVQAAADHLDWVMNDLEKSWGLTSDQADATVKAAMKLVHERYKATGRWRP